MSELVITKENFESEVINSTTPVLIDLWASWCGPCMMLAPVIEEIADEYDGKIKVGKINVDDEPELAAAFGVSSIPYVVVLNNGKVIASSVGYKDKDDIVSLFEDEI